MPINVDVTSGNDAGTAKFLIAANSIAKAGNILKCSGSVLGWPPWNHVSGIRSTALNRTTVAVYHSTPSTSRTSRTALLHSLSSHRSSIGKHAWKDAVPPPPTYIMEVPSRVHPLVSNYNEPEHVHRRKMLHRDPTPSGHRSTPRDVTPQRRDPFLSAHAPSDQSQPDPSPRFGPGTPPRSRQPTGSENWRPSTFPPATSGPPISFGPSASTTNSPGPQRIAAPLSNPVPIPSPSYAAMPLDHAQPSTGPEFDWNAESDHDLPLPPAELKISPSPVWAPPTFSTDIVTNVPNWFTRTIPPRHCRDLHIPL